VRGVVHWPAPCRPTVAGSGHGRCGSGLSADREAGARVEALFLTALADGDFTAVDLTSEDYRRASELVTTYADLPLGTTDTTVIALAERLGVREIATLDRATSPSSGRGTCQR
jgi:predicted nucleic acid-binding protein